MNKQQTVIVLDFGIPQSQNAVRRIREAGVYCEILPSYVPFETVKAKSPIALVLVGNEQSDTANLDTKMLSIGIPILSIGLKLQGGNIIASGILAQDINTDLSKNIIKDFLYNKAKAVGDWTMANFVANMVQSIRAKVGDKKVLCAMSGGVDSAVAATLVYKAVGKQLTSMLVDHGLMRKNEAEQVVSVFRDGLGMNLIKIDAQDRFLARLAGVTEPEKKRKIIGEEFIRVFEEEGRKLGKVNFLVQGTIYPDVIESGIGGAVIKSHHNVGGLPSVIDFDDIIEPLRQLYKDEVRQVGLELGLSKEIVMRQPFPGPGLGVRVIGELTKEKLDILRDADAIFREEIALNNLSEDIWQYFAVLTSMRSVGKRNETRTYDYTLALRAVHSIDAMTADWAKIPYPVLQKVSSRITSEVAGINRIVYDITSKPPATIEWE